MPTNTPDKSRQMPTNTDTAAHHRPDNSRQGSIEPSGVVGVVACRHADGWKDIKTLPKGVLVLARPVGWKYGRAVVLGYLAPQGAPVVKQQDGNGVTCSHWHHLPEMPA